MTLISPCLELEQIGAIVDGMRLVRGLDLQAIDVDELKQKLDFYFLGEERWGRVAGYQRLFRAVRCQQRPEKRNDIFCAPLEKLNTFGRCNRPQQAVFYTAGSVPAALYEIGAHAGDRIAVGEWAEKHALLYFLGTSEEDRKLYEGPTEVRRQDEQTYRAQVRNSNNPSLWIEEPWARRRSLVSEVANKAMMCEFARPIKEGREHEFKLTVALAERLRESVIAKFDRTSVRGLFAGIVYPSRGFRNNSNNVVLFPDLLHELQLTSVFYLQIEKVNAGVMYHVTQLDYADSIASDGTIIWGGPRPWRLGAGAEAKFSLEYGNWFGRDATGRKIGYSKHYYDGWDELI